ncbi:chase domain-containing protein [Polychytrium aggregatum]|uniref:chase domain-containing protein n=1 Tax=Polychytrium aggregatum TaxID=110093 RepID=UPI0022FEBD91|nr:chase domain-containing protein [Polychytrium aggregatum]KAI9204963.1 chase domain-containing protein [Polychytrium aggregatum]
MSKSVDQEIGKRSVRSALAVPEDMSSPRADVPPQKVSLFRRVINYYLRHYSIFVLITSLMLSIPIAIYKWQIAFQDEVSIAEDHFLFTAQTMATAVESKLNSSIFYTKMMANYFIAENGTVSRKNFHTATSTSIWSNPFLQAVEFAPYVTSYQQRLSWEAEGQQNYLPTFTYTEKLANGTLIVAPNETVYYAVQYAEPVAGNTAAFGYDLYSEPIRRAAIDQAIQTGGIASTARVRLVQSVIPEYGALIMMPLYVSNGSVVTGLSGTTNQAFGIVIGVTKISMVINAALSELALPGNIDLFLFDMSNTPGNQYLGHYSITPSAQYDNFTYASAMLPSSISGDISYAYSINSVDRSWAVVISARTGFIDSQHTFVPTKLLLLGLLEPALTLIFHLSLLLLQKIKKGSDGRSRFELSFREI